MSSFWALNLQPILDNRSMRSQVTLKYVQLWQNMMKVNGALSWIGIQNRVKAPNAGGTD